MKGKYMVLAADAVITKNNKYIDLTCEHHYDYFSVTGLGRIVFNNKEEIESFINNDWSFAISKEEVKYVIIESQLYSIEEFPKNFDKGRWIIEWFSDHPDKYTKYLQLIT